MAVGRAFQLLQLMNNTPSLPNSVPGKLTPRDAPTLLMRTLPASQWQSATRCGQWTLGTISGVD